MDPKFDTGVREKFKMWVYNWIKQFPKVGKIDSHMRTRYESHMHQVTTITDVVEQIKNLFHVVQLINQYKYPTQFVKKPGQKKKGGVHIGGVAKKKPGVPKPKPGVSKPKPGPPKPDAGAKIPKIKQPHKKAKPKQGGAHVPGPIQNPNLGPHQPGPAGGVAGPPGGGVGAGVAGPAQMVLNQEDTAWNAFEARTDHNTTLTRIIRANQHKRFLQWNPYLQVVEPIIRHRVLFKPRRPNSGIYAREEIHEMRYHPLRKLMEDRQLELLSKNRDPLHDVPGERANLGSFISMKSTPSTTDVVIRKGVQKKALYILAQHIKNQHEEVPTRVLVKRTKKGKYTFGELLSRKALSKMLVKTLAEKLHKLVKKTKKHVHLLLKASQQGGKIHEMIASNMSLL